MRAHTAFIAALSSLLLATPAVANRAGDAAIKAPELEDHHVAFTLPGDGWTQKVGALSGTPASDATGSTRSSPTALSAR